MVAAVGSVRRVEPDGLWLESMGGRLDGDAQGDTLAAGVGWGHALFVDVALDGHDAFDEHLGSGWAAGDIDIDGDELIDALDGGVCVEDAAG